MENRNSGRHSPGGFAPFLSRLRSFAKRVEELYRKIGHRVSGGVVVLAGLALAAWGVFGNEGLLRGDADVPMAVAWLALGSLILVAGIPDGLWK